MPAPEEEDDSDSSGSEILEGDVKGRKTLRIPDSLPELTHAAAQVFGKGHSLRMYYRGKRHRRLHHPSHLKWLNDNDNVVVEAEGPPKEMPPMRSTHQMDFTAPPLVDTSPFKQDHGSALSEWTQGPFAGNSSYRQDYPRRPNSAREAAVKVPCALRSARGAPTGTTSYRAHYPWKTGEPEVPGKGLGSTLTSEQKNAPFQGRSSYNNDYVKHPVSAAQPVPPPRSQRPLPSTFDGGTTYNKDFLEHTEDPRLPSARPAFDVPPPRPLLGATEYGLQYTKKEVKAPVVHLDPFTGQSRFKKRAAWRGGGAKMTISGMPSDPAPAP